MDTTEDNIVYVLMVIFKLCHKRSYWNRCLNKPIHHGNIPFTSTCWECEHYLI